MTRKMIYLSIAIGVCATVFVLLIVFKHNSNTVVASSIIATIQKEEEKGNYLEAYKILYEIEQSNSVVPEELKGQYYLLYASVIGKLDYEKTRRDKYLQLALEYQKDYHEKAKILSQLVQINMDANNEDMVFFYSSERMNIAQDAGKAQAILSAKLKHIEVMYYLEKDKEVKTMLSNLDSTEISEYPDLLAIYLYQKSSYVNDENAINYAEKAAEIMKQMQDDTAKDKIEMWLGNLYYINGLDEEFTLLKQNVSESQILYFKEIEALYLQNVSEQYRQAHEMRLAVIDEYVGKKMYKEASDAAEYDLAKAQEAGNKEHEIKALETIITIKNSLLQAQNETEKERQQLYAGIIQVEKYVISEINKEKTLVMTITYAGVSTYLVLWIIFIAYINTGNIKRKYHNELTDVHNNYDEVRKSNEEMKKQYEEMQEQNVYVSYAVSTTSDEMIRQCKEPDKVISKSLYLQYLIQTYQYKRLLKDYISGKIGNDVFTEDMPRRIMKNFKDIVILRYGMVNDEQMEAIIECQLPYSENIQKLRSIDEQFVST